MRVLRQDPTLCRRMGRSTNPSIAAATTLEDQDLNVIMAPTQSTEEKAARSQVHLQSMHRKLSPYSRMQAKY